MQDVRTIPAAAWNVNCVHFTPWLWTSRTDNCIVTTDSRCLSWGCWTPIYRTFLLSMYSPPFIFPQSLGSCHTAPPLVCNRNFPQRMFTALQWDNIICSRTLPPTLPSSEHSSEAIRICASQRAVLQTPKSFLLSKFLSLDRLTIQRVHLRLSPVSFTSLQYDLLAHETQKSYFSCCIEMSLLFLLRSLFFRDNLHNGPSRKK